MRELAVLDVEREPTEVIGLGVDDALGAAVRRLLDDPAEAARVAARGRAVAATWPTEQDTLDQVLAVYRELRP